MVCTSYKTTCNVLSHTQLWFWGDWVNLCVSGVGCVDSGNLKGDLLRKIVSRFKIFRVWHLQHQPYTPPKDVRFTWLKLSSFYLLVCHTIFHCLVFFTASPHYWHSSWLCTLCKSCKIRKNRGKNTQTVKWLFSFLIDSGCNPFNQNFQVEFPQFPWMNGVVFSNNLLIAGDIISDNNTWDTTEFICKFLSFWPVDWTISSKSHSSENTLIINTMLVTTQLI